MFENIIGNALKIDFKTACFWMLKFVQNFLMNIEICTLFYRGKSWKFCNWRTCLQLKLEYFQIKMKKILCGTASKFNSKLRRSKVSMKSNMRVTKNTSISWIWKNGMNRIFFQDLLFFRYDPLFHKTIEKFNNKAEQLIWKIINLYYFRRKFKPKINKWWHSLANC